MSSMVYSLAPAEIGGYVTRPYPPISSYLAIIQRLRLILNIILIRNRLLDVWIYVGKGSATQNKFTVNKLHSPPLRMLSLHK